MKFISLFPVNIDNRGFAKDKMQMPGRKRQLCTQNLLPPTSTSGFRTITEYNSTTVYGEFVMEKT